MNNTMGHDVFISFAFKDEEAANKIYSYLKNNGVNCFWCKDLPGGAKYGQELGKAIIDSKIILLLLSSATDASDSVYQEVMIAHNNKIKKIPLRLENVSPVNLAYPIAGNLYFDAFPPRLERYLHKLTDDIKQHLGKPTIQTPVIPPPKPHPIQTPRKLPTGWIRDNKWHDIDYKDLAPWLKERIKELNAGRQLEGRTFRYRRNGYTGRYERKLRNK